MIMTKTSISKPHLLEKEQEYMDIPKNHQELVMHRFKKVRNDASRLLDWEDVKYQWQKAIVNKRLEEIEKGNVKFLDFDDVIKEIRKEL